MAPVPRVEQVVLDSVAPAVAAEFWAGLTGGSVVRRDQGWCHVDVPGFARIAFQPSPLVSGGSRMHLDLVVPSGALAAATARAVALGATPAGAVTTNEKGSCQVMHDVDQNVFCLVSD